MFKTIIIDDEEQSRIILREELKNDFDNIEIVGEADSVKSAVALIRSLNPDLVLLDIQLTDGTGFTILQQIKEINFQIIFITAYDQYALKALKLSAVDYLLKPIDREELKIAISKAEKAILNNRDSIDIELILKSFIPQNQNQKKISINSSEGIHLFESDEILRCESEGNYTTFYIVNGEKLIVAKTLKEVEQLFEKKSFERIHQSHIVNLKHVKKYVNRDGGAIILSDGTEIPVAQRKKTKLLALIR